MPHHALIIDDNAMNIEVLEQLLKGEGVTSTSVMSPTLISRTIEELDRIDVVFLDLEFPNGDGFQSLSDLQNNPTLQGIPIVAYTVHISEQNEARMAGFHSFLGKPLCVDRFSGQLEMILRGEPVWDAGD